MKASLARTGAVLWVAGVVGACLVLPYTLELEGSVLQASALRSGLSVASLIAISVAQAAILLAVATFAGLWAARKIGLHVGAVGRGVALAIGLGVACGVVLVLLDQTVFPPLVPRANATANPAIWKGLLASFYGGIDEELLLRLGLLSLLALALQRLSSAGDELRPGPFWAANILAALVFGLGHLPATAAIVPLTPIVVARALVLNGLAGIVFGWLYWRRGLQRAMLGHFSTDIVLHVLAPLALTHR